MFATFKVFERAALLVWNRCCDYISRTGATMPWGAIRTG